MTSMRNRLKVSCAFFVEVCKVPSHFIFLSLSSFSLLSPADLNLMKGNKDVMAMLMEGADLHAFMSEVDGEMQDMEQGTIADCKNYALSRYCAFSLSILSHTLTHSPLTSS